MSKKSTAESNPVVESTLEQVKAEKKAAKKKSTGPKMDIQEYLVSLGVDENADEVEEGEGMGKIQTILKLYVRGYSKSQIVKAGFNKSTVYRQTKEYDKLRNAPVKSYYGHEAYENRIQRAMRMKGLDRDAAAEYLATKDEQEG